MKIIAKTGIGSNFCLRFGFLPVSIHFYQPIPDIQDLKKRNIWGKKSQLSCINIEKEKSLNLIKNLAEKYENECDWPNDPTDDNMQFYLHNGSFSYGCAAPLHCIIRDLKPNRIIEIGSGNSSKIITEAITLNSKEGFNTKYTIIDPYFSLPEDDFPKNTQIIKQRVELVDIELFKTINKNDILFIDSSHISKIGSDVNFLILDVLPILKENVFIHFHDIPLPFEYPKTYSINKGVKVFWTEAYLLQAFLSCNKDFEILLPMSYLQHYHLKELKTYFPKSNNTNWGWISGSFWIKRVK